MLALAELFQAHPWMLLTVGFVFGITVGSFLNVVILRLPPVLEYGWSKDCSEHLGVEFKDKKPQGLVFERSHCPKCKQHIPAWYNIPLIGYLILRGRCASCGQSISFRYPAIEFLTGALTTVVLFYNGFSLQSLALVLLTWWLIVIAFIDLDTFLLPDQLSLTLLWLGLFFSLFDFSLAPSDAIIGALVGYLSLWSLFQVFKLITGKEGMGYGDFKLLAAGGAWLGFSALLPVLIISSVSGLLLAILQKLFGNGASKIPFGPYLAIGIWIMAIFEKQLTILFFPYL